jgi:hypothetical protein
MSSNISVTSEAAGTFLFQESGKAPVMASTETASKLLKDFGVGDPITILEKTRRWGRVQIVNAAVQKLGHSF